MLPQVRGYVFPNGDVSEKQFEKALAEIEGVGFAWRYTAGTFDYLWLPGFWKHQKINRPSESPLPPHPKDPYRLLSVLDALAQYKADTDSGLDPLSDDSLNAQGKISDGSTLVRAPAQAGGSDPVPFSAVEPSVTTEDARELFELWRQRCNHPDAKFTAERRAKVQARLKEGYTADQVRAAIEGAARGAFVNDAGTRFDDLELICRSGSKLESFVKRSGQPVGGSVVPIGGQRRERPDYDRAAGLTA
jgi:hypothetical protein